MPSVQWHDVKEWQEGEKVSADEMVEQISDNLTWLFEHNIDVAQVSGISDYNLTTLSTWYDVGALRCQIGKARDETLVKLALNASGYHNTNGGYLYFDVLVDGSWYASSGTSTPLTDGLFWFRQAGAGYAKNLKFDFYLRDVPKGVHEFKLQWYITAGQAYINTTNTIAQFSVEEYGVSNVNPI